MRALFKWIPRLMLCVVILFIIAGVVAYLMNKASEPPSVKAAPWAIQTFSNDKHRVPSRIFYAEEVEIIDGTPVLMHYWSYDGEKYRSHKGDKDFPEDIYGSIKITRRK